jgi:signal transduction histidine kinase/predicted CoA-binding protein
MFDFLKKVPLFENLPAEDLDRLCSVTVEETISAGKTLFIEGEVGDKAFVIMEGEVDIFKESGGQNVLLATRMAGEVIGEMSLLEQAPRFASGQTRTDCKLLTISHENLEHLLETSSSAARVMLSTITNRLRSTEIVLRQSEKMAQLGNLTAGITHELNNPASAARRGSQHLNAAIEHLQQAYQQFYAQGFTKEQWEKAAELRDYAQMQAAQPVDLDSLGRSDREYEIELWLDDQDIEDSWELAPVMVSLGYQTSDLEDLGKTFPAHQLVVALQWLGNLYTIYSLLEEIKQGTTRIGEIVKSLKSYVYLDQAPIQEVDVHEGLDNTLVMLRSKLKSGIELERHYADDLPKIMAYGSELNQVWTNIIDNAVDAMDGAGKITIRTWQQGDWVFAEIEDTGPGIPEEIQEKVFSPFFTTKPMGKGTGLGLNISFNIVQKHKGEIKVSSRPGKTSFSVCLPVDFERVGNGYMPRPALDRVSDEELLEILDSTRTIAVVGISTRAQVPAHSVPKYLQEQGYTILPINPNHEQVMGQKAYPDLLSLQSPPDLVLVFRPSEYVPQIVNHAVEIGAKVVWLQEGIISPEAAGTAREAGIQMVMDTCMRKTHQRLKVPV